MNMFYLITCSTMPHSVSSTSPTSVFFPSSFNDRTPTSEFPLLHPSFTLNSHHAVLIPGITYDTSPDSVHPDPKPRRFSVQQEYAHVIVILSIFRIRPYSVLASLGPNSPFLPSRFPSLLDAQRSTGNSKDLQRNLSAIGDAIPQQFVIRHYDIRWRSPFIPLLPRILSSCRLSPHSHLIIRCRNVDTFAGDVSSSYPTAVSRSATALTPIFLISQARQTTKFSYHSYRRNSDFQKTKTGRPVVPEQLSRRVTFVSFSYTPTSVYLPIYGMI
ncbi:hypothetical protein K474DRAFT_455903 [Panus rudis PR-1116 ss-1]|nr:hypothetical protein K474DRAFT_455903 [Panus rudis PR-1116 ss-1]